MAATGQPLEPDTFDSDSAISELRNGSTDSPTPSMLTVLEENGRTYHAMSSGKYPFPNDIVEQERLDFQHLMWTVTLGDKLCLCPKGSQKAKRVLDAGTGTGIWAMDYADAHPEAKVIGVDLSNIQPKWTPPNLTWELDDLEQDWTWSQPFDFVFVRMLAGSLKDYQDFVNQAFENLEPGGYLEMQDLSLPYRCDDGSLTEENPVHKLSDLFLRGGRVTGRHMDKAPIYKDLMRNAGFVDIVEEQFKWPVNAWPRDPHFKTLGAWTHCNLDHGLEGLTLGLATRNLRWSREETLLFCATVRKTLRSHKAHAYIPLYVVYGRKPAEAKRGDSKPPAGIQ
ncbi:TAM domain methyltransferase [Colletotrichum orchidophilum]|uniref:TAM domain methyltransferase n=1 Tax=Colletotrichum orchidophilum TaxID=1209926 RepID=A0A1G4B379_9PEZI|nr:TAM domain methyltransferase [Colletotrichum orchidophilum]OHE95879.1 TAM domain methyltransferase [Colletotrichum orchidophilum]